MFDITKNHCCLMNLHCLWVINVCRFNLPTNLPCTEYFDSTLQTSIKGSLVVDQFIRNINLGVIGSQNVSQSESDLSPCSCKPYSVPDRLVTHFKGSPNSVSYRLRITFEMFGIPNLHTICIFYFFCSCYIQQDKFPMSQSTFRFTFEK